VKERVSELSGIPLLRAVSPFIGVSFSSPNNYLPKASPTNTTTLEARNSTYKLGGHNI
jgi:hypothetical protein